MDAELLKLFAKTEQVYVVVFEGLTVIVGVVAPPGDHKNDGLTALDIATNVAELPGQISLEEFDIVKLGICAFKFNVAKQARRKLVIDFKAECIKQT